MSAGGEHTNGIVGDDLSSSFERGCCLDGFTDVGVADKSARATSEQSPQAVSALRGGIANAGRDPLELASDLNRFTSHSIGCAIYQQSWASGEPRCSCGLDGLRVELAGIERLTAIIRAKAQEPIFLKMRSDMPDNYRTPTEIAACCVWAGEPSPGHSIPVSAREMSTCNKCGAQYPSAPVGTIHKCGRCSGGMCVRNAPAPVDGHPQGEDPLGASFMTSAVPAGKAP